MDQIAVTQKIGHSHKDNPETPNKIVIAIDELDRCRPDYALSVLEVIKHFFDVDNVHFLLGVNLNELANSVRARYGDKTDAERYLQKFISLTLSLPSEVATTHSSFSIARKYFADMSKAMSLPPDMIEAVERYLKRPAIIRAFSLRTIERLLTEMALVPQDKIQFAKFYGCYKTLIAGLLVLKAGFPAIYSQAKAGTLQIHAIRESFGITADTDRDADHSGWLLNLTWMVFLTPSEIAASERKGSGNYFGEFGDAISETSFAKCIEDYTQTISLGAKID